ncbi:MAG: hypothetical protein GXY83_19935 [Rhodopirellula sp.]|nr:hypothetical protein [Rhodopirellula sp.]
MVRRARLFHEFTPAEIQPAVEQLAELVEQHRRDGLARLYRCGEILAMAFDAASERIPQRLEGDDEERFTVDVARIMREPPRDLWAWWMVVVRWNRTEFEELCEHRRVTASHLAIIAPIEDVFWRQRKLTEVIEKGLTPEKLWQSARSKVKRREIFARRKAAGATIFSAERGMERLTSQIERLTRLLDDVRLAAGAAVPDLLRSSPTGRSREVVRTQVMESVQMLDELGRKIDNGIVAFTDVESQLNERPAVDDPNGGSAR